MLSGGIHLDLSEIVAMPLRTGIQRVVREAIRFWPNRDQLHPCYVDASGQMLSLAPRTLDVLCTNVDAGTVFWREEERKTLITLMNNAEPIVPGKIDRLLNLELFFDRTRADSHRRLADNGVSVLYYVYDFLPYLRPELFPQGTAKGCMHFLRGLRSASRVAFISGQTRDDYAVRFARMRSAIAPGPVIGLGADGLRLEKQHFSPKRRDFVSLGTVEQRKNTMALLQAFEMLWLRGRDVPLIVAGKLSGDAKSALAFFEKHAHNPLLTVLEEPSDERIRAVLRGARALVMPSEAEGFGLPPYEAVFAGIPTIASVRLPSVPMITDGVLPLEHMTPETIADAVESLCDDAMAARLWSEAARVSLPTWEEFGRELSEWALTD